MLLVDSPEPQSLGCHAPRNSGDILESIREVVNPPVDVRLILGKLVSHESLLKTCFVHGLGQKKLGMGEKYMGSIWISDGFSVDLGLVFMHL